MKPRKQTPDSQPQQRAIVVALVKWFHKNQRAMPWRETRDAYCIWLSEVMLQQTQVVTVIPYYKKFLERFPKVTDLASAPLDDVLKLWAGLGYYSRARNLHRGAQVIAERFGGCVPDTLELIREVPGIGPYTAGAVLSIAYGVKQPLVDGNVARVLSRLFLLKGDYRKSGKETVWAAAKSLIDCCDAEIYPGDLNQALMELGATVCTPRTPDCARCPLAEHCQARKLGVQQDYPQLEQKVAVPTWNLRAWVVEDLKGRLLFAQRENSGLFGGLWEVPTERLEKPARKKDSKPLAKLTHVLTHRVLEIEAARAEDKSAKSFAAPESFPCWSGKYTRYLWLDRKSALSGEQIALSSVQKKLLKALGKGQ